VPGRTKPLVFKFVKFAHKAANTTVSAHPPARQPAMRAVFTSVTRRLFRRRSLLAALQPAPPAAPASRKGKSRHELVSEAHIAYMQQASSYTTASSSSLSLPLTNGCGSGRCGGEGEESSSSPFESLCHELRRVEESMSRYLRVPTYRAVASEPY
jgi:hypothetical protein